MSETGDTQQPIGDWPDGDDIWVPTAAQPPAAPQSVPSVIPTDIPPVFAQPAGGAGDGGGGPTTVTTRTQTSLTPPCAPTFSSQVSRCSWAAHHWTPPSDSVPSLGTADSPRMPS